MSVDSRSRVENILNVTLDRLDPSVLEPPQSRVETLLQLLDGDIQHLEEIAGKLPIHICVEGEFNPTTGEPTIQDPDVDIFYLVPDGSSTNLYSEWVYTGTSWEQFGNTTVPVTDVQVDGTSIVSNGVADVPVADTSNKLGLVKVGGSGLQVNSNGQITTQRATNDEIKAGINNNKPIVPSSQQDATFYGLAKAAGDSTQSASANAVGTYTEDAKSAISEMLNGSVSVSGSTPTIAAKPGVRYVCGEVATLAITVPATGIIDVVFESGSTATVLTVTPPTGVTAIKWPAWFDPDHLDANTVYEINIMDGEYGVVGSWT